MGLEARLGIQGLESCSLFSSVSWRIVSFKSPLAAFNYQEGRMGKEAPGLLSSDLKARWKPRWLTPPGAEAFISSVLTTFMTSWGWPRSVPVGRSREGSLMAFLPCVTTSECLLVKTGLLLWWLEALY